VGIGDVLSLPVPPFDETRPSNGSATPPVDFEEDFVNGFSLGDGAVDYFAVNVIVDHDVLYRTGFFCGTGYIEWCQPSQHMEDVGGDFQHVSIHTTLSSNFQSNVSPIATIATDAGS
jgi:hypothetical protein